MEFFFKIGLSGLLSLLIMWGVELAGHWIAWWAAVAIALVIVFGGFVIFDDDVDWFT